MAEQVNEPKGKLQLPRMMMVVIILPWIFMMVGFGIFIVAQKITASKQTAAPATATAAKPAKTAQATPGTTISLKEFLVNLKAPEDHHVKLILALQLKKGVKEEEVKPYEAKIRYMVISNLRNQTITDLNSPNGVEMLRYKLKNVVNRIVPDGQVYDVFITDVIYD